MHTVDRNPSECGGEMCAHQLVTLVVYPDRREGGSQRSMSVFYGMMIL